MGLIVGEVVVREQQFLHGGEVGAILQLDIDHAAMDARAERDGHRERVFHSGDGLCRHGVPHASAGTEVSVGDALGRDGGQQGADHGVRTGVPAGGNDTYRLVGLSQRVQLLAKVINLPVNVETIDRADAATQKFLRKGGHFAGRRAQCGHVRLNTVQIVAMMVNTCELHVLGGHHRLFHGLSDVAVSDNCDASLHIFPFLKVQKYEIIRKIIRESFFNKSLHIDHIKIILSRFCPDSKTKNQQPTSVNC